MIVERELGLKARTGFEEGLRRMIEWYKKYGRKKCPK